MFNVKPEPFLFLFCVQRIIEEHAYRKGEEEDIIKDVHEANDHEPMMCVVQSSSNINSGQRAALSRVRKVNWSKSQFGSTTPHASITPFLYGEHDSHELHDV